MKKMIIVFIIATSFITCFQAKSQTVTLEDIKAQLVKDWQRAKDYTISYLNTMPADKYSFKANDSIRSFAQQMLHLAAANIFLMSNASSEKPPAWLSFTLEKQTGAQSKDSVMYYVMASYDYAINTAKNSVISQWGDEKDL